MKTSDKKSNRIKWDIEGTVTDNEVLYRKGNLTITLHNVGHVDTLVKISYKDRVNRFLNIQKELLNFLRTMKIFPNYEGSFVNEYKDIQYVTGAHTESISVLIKDCLPLDIVKRKYTLVKTNDSGNYDVLDLKQYKRHPISIISYDGPNKGTLVFSLAGVNLSITRDKNRIWTIDDITRDGLPTKTKDTALISLIKIFTNRGKLWCDVADHIYYLFEKEFAPYKEAKPELKLSTKVKYGERLKGCIPFLLP